MLTLTPGQLTLAQLRQIAQGTDPIALDADCWDNVRASSQAVQAIVAAGEPAYGINTGFGKLAKVHIPREQLEQLQTKPGALARRGHGAIARRCLRAPDLRHQDCFPGAGLLRCTRADADHPDRGLQRRDLALYPRPGFGRCIR